MEAIRRLPVHGGVAATSEFGAACARLLAAAHAAWIGLISTSKAARLLQLRHVKLRRL